MTLERAIAKDLGDDINLALVGLLLPGCSTASTFVCKGKVKPLALPKQHPEFLPAFHALGTCVDIEDSVLKEIEKFTRLMYGSNRVI